MSTTIGPQDRFAPPTEADVARLVRSQPLAWVVSHADGDVRATALPLRPEGDDDTRSIPAFLGHFAASNPHAAFVRRAPRALLLFLGVNGYVSPSWMRDRTQAPTWNYVSLQYLVDIEPLERPDARDTVLADAVAAQEAGRPGAWHSGEMGARYEVLAKRVVAFRAVVIERRAKFKLGQDERDDVYADITQALTRDGATELCDWMERANPPQRRR
jgi:transcriptional regulator